MLDTRYVRIPHYEVFDKMQDGKEVMCLNRAKCTCFNLTKLSCESAVAIVKEAEEADNRKGSSYYNVAQYDFWYVEIVDVKEEAECKAE